MKDIKFIVSRYFVKYFNVRFIFNLILWIGITNDELKNINKHLIIAVSLENTLPCRELENFEDL